MGGDHKCPVCQATFTRPQHVARHMRSHTGDRPYKCQFCGDQFARSDLLSRHVNKCHSNEKPLPSTGNTRRKGSASASRATTSKQFCDQCVQSSLPCDGSNPCTKCVQRKHRCTYVKFHRQTAPAGPGHNSARPATAAAAAGISGIPMSRGMDLSGLGESSSPSSSRIPLYHPTMNADDDFILGPPPPSSSSSHHHQAQVHVPAASTRGNNGIPTMTSALYASNSFDFPTLYPPPNTPTTAGTRGSVASTSSDGGDVDPEYVAAAKYRAQAQAELFSSGSGTESGRSAGLGVGVGLYDPRPASTSASAASATTGGAWLAWDQQHQHQHQHQQMRHPEAYVQQQLPHQRQQQQLSGTVDNGLGGGGDLGIGVGGAGTVGSTLHDNPSHFMHATRSARGHYRQQQQQQQQQLNPLPPRADVSDVHDGLDLRLGAMGGVGVDGMRAPMGMNLSSSSSSSSVALGLPVGMSMSMSMPSLPMSAPEEMGMGVPLGMNLGGFDGGGGEDGNGGSMGIGGYSMFGDLGAGDTTRGYHDIDRAATSSASTTASSGSESSSRHHQHGGHQRSQHESDNDHAESERRKERQEFQNAFGSMSLDDDDANVTAGIEGNREAFFSDPAQAHNHPTGEGSGKRTTSSSMTDSQGTTDATNTGTNLNPNPAMGRDSDPNMNMNTPMRDFWKAYMRSTPLSGPGSGSDAAEPGSCTTPNKGAPSAPAAGGYRRPRVASLPSAKTPSVEWEREDVMLYGGGGGMCGQYPMQPGGHGQSHDPLVSKARPVSATTMRTMFHPGQSNHTEDLRSYEAAVMARKAPTVLNLNPNVRRSKARGFGGAHGSQQPSASAQGTALSHSSSASSLANAFRGGGGGSSNDNARGALAKVEDSESPSIPSSSSHGSPAVVDDVVPDTDALRPSFKRLPSQTLGPSNAKRAFLGRGVGTSSVGGGFSGGSAVSDSPSCSGRSACEQSVVGLSYPDRVVASLAERRKRKRRMSAPTSTSGGAGLVEGVGDD